TERDEFVRSHDALVLQRDTLAHERDEIRQERDREISKMRDELAKASSAPAAPPAPVETPKPGAIEHAMSELHEMTGRPSAKPPKMKQTAIEHAIAEIQEGMTSGQPSSGKKKSSVAKTYSTARQDPRQAFPNALGVQI